MDLKVILDATYEHIEKLTIKRVNQRRFCDNLCNSVRQKNSRCTVLRTIESYLLPVENM